MAWGLQDPVVRSVPTEALANEVSSALTHNGITHMVKYKSEDRYEIAVDIEDGDTLHSIVRHATMNKKESFQRG